MPFPKITTCLVCELARPEGTKFSLLGFHGITPDVRIGLIEFPGTVEFLTFVLIGARGEGAGTFDIDWNVVAPNNEITWTGGIKEITIPANPEAKLNLIIRASNAAFPLKGIYRLNLLVDNQLHYKTEISAAPLEQIDDHLSHGGSIASPVA